MPTYVYKCPNCNVTFERFAKVADYDRPQAHNCGAIGVKQITPVLGFVQPNYEAYKCPVTGKVIDGKKKHLENLKQTGCRLLEPGEKENVMKQRQKEDEAFDKAVDSTVEELCASLTPDKQEKLASELASGATVSVERL